MKLDKLENVRDGEIFFQLNEEFEDCYTFSGAYNIKTQIGIIDNTGAIKDTIFIKNKNQVVAILEHKDTMPHAHSNFPVYK